MRLVYVLVMASSLAAVALLLLLPRRGAPAAGPDTFDAAALRAPRPVSGTAAATPVRSTRADRTAHPQPAPHSEREAAQPPTTPRKPHVAPDFGAELASRIRDGGKHAFEGLLADWRTGRLTPEQDRELGEAVGSLGSPEVDKAAGHLLLESETVPAQREGLSALLAASGSEEALTYLLAACKRPHLRPEAAAALATVSDLRALPVLVETVSSDTDRETLEAVLAALRNMDAAKARDLEARIEGYFGAR